MNRKKEKLIVYRIIKRLGLKKCNSKFKYWKKRKKIIFKWDGAGIDKNDSIFLIEAELSNPISWHIECHINRVWVMISCGEKVKKLVWVTYSYNYKKLRSIVDTWLNYFSPICSLKFPQVEYRTPDGTPLFSV